jgi:hypothetical protein
VEQQILVAEVVALVVLAVLALLLFVTHQHH